LKLAFDASGNCTVSASPNSVQGLTATGTGKYVEKGDKKSWGGVDCDVLYLDYTVNHDGITYTTKDTLVIRDRGVKAEWFTVK